jgi:hypothetical protein
MPFFFTRRGRTLVLGLLLYRVWAPAQTDETAVHLLESAAPAAVEPLAETLPEAWASTAAAASGLLDLNEAGADELQNLLGLPPAAVENLLAYRAALGPLLNVYELQAVPGWDLALIRAALARGAFIGADALDTRRAPWWQGLYRGENQLLVRWAPTPAGTSAPMEGRTGPLALRLRHRLDARLRWGLTAENDAGEALARGSNRHGFDFYSAHAFLQPQTGRLRTLALGDYTARLGQGLLMQTGFSPGKSAEIASVVRAGGAVLAPYGAFGEAYFLRGAAAGLQLGRHWQVHALYSNRRRDANRPGDSSAVFTALQTSGLHRTAAERADEKAVREQVAGLNVGYHATTWRLSANAVYIHYDHAWMPSPAPHRQFAFRGRALAAVSVDYRWQVGNWCAFGETARSGNGAVAAVNGFSLALDRRLLLTALHRALPAHYQTVYGSAVAEAGGASNEHGLYLGIDLRPLRQLSISAYADSWRHPWLRFGADAPSSGFDRLVRLSWTPRKTFALYMLWQHGQRNDDLGDTRVAERPAPAAQQQCRLHAVFRLHRDVELRSRVEWKWYRPAGGATGRGVAAYQELVVQPRGAPYALSARYALFETENYETRIYAYERDLYGAVSIPAQAGSGIRWYVNASWRCSRRLRLEGRMEETVVRHAVTEGSTAGRQRAVKMQGRWNF